MSALEFVHEFNADYQEPGSDECQESADIFVSGVDYLFNRWQGQIVRFVQYGYNAKFPRDSLYLRDTFEGHQLFIAVFRRYTNDKLRAQGIDVVYQGPGGADHRHYALDTGGLVRRQDPNPDIAKAITGQETEDDLANLEFNLDGIFNLVLVKPDEVAALCAATAFGEPISKDEYALATRFIVQSIR